MTHRKLWTPQEDQVIIRLIEVYGTNQWTSVASEMKSIMPSTRSSKQIRERWYNQLCPSISKIPWKAAEESALFQAHAEIGNKWKQIAGRLHGRTDNAVKNHFYSTIRRALRRMDKNFGFKDSTRKMRNLKPSALTYFLEVSHSLEIYTDMMDLILQFAQWKPTRQNKKDFKENTKHIYEKILEILSEYKQVRPEMKSIKKMKSSSHLLEMENESTESDKLSFDLGLCEQASQVEEFNYFGRSQLRSWFNVNQREEIVLENGIDLPCDLDREQ